jgi:hypothetical protein
MDLDRLLDELDVPEPDPWFTRAGGHSFKALAPPHIWHTSDFDTQRCHRCGLSRFATADGTLYQLKRGELRMGAEPMCVRKRT